MLLFKNVLNNLRGFLCQHVRSGELTRSYIIVALLIVVGLAIVFFTTFVQQAEYQIQFNILELVQGDPTSSYLPLKVNPAGVIPLSLLARLQQFLVLFFHSSRRLHGYHTYKDYSRIVRLVE